MKTYIYLKVGDRLEEGDEFLDAFDTWYETWDAGFTIKNKTLLYRRLIKQNHPSTNIFK